jgi:hypothetical protein
MVQPQQQQSAVSARDEWLRMKQAAGQSDHDPLLETALDRAVYAYGVFSGQIDPGTPASELQGKVIDLPTNAQQTRSPLLT